MSSLPERCVVDASIIVRALLRGPESFAANEYIDRLAKAETVFLAPDLLYAECANAALKYLRARLIDEEGAHRMLRGIDRYRIVALPIRPLVPSAVTFANEFQISAYDACYVVAAVEHQATFLTADKKLARKLPKNKLDVVSLDDLMSSEN